MKLFDRWRKPAWERKDPKTRLAAVRGDNAPALLAALPELAQRDPDAGVRAAALGRVTDAALLARRLRGEQDLAAATIARERLLVRLCSTDLPLEAGQVALREVLDADILIEVATRSPQVALRRSALERLHRPGFLVERCLRDPDAEIRLWLLERIDSPDALQRIADASRKSDKRLTRAARERKQRLQIASGNVAALRDKALALCEQLSQIARELPAEGKQKIDSLRAEWRSLVPELDAELRHRGESGLEMAAMALAAAEGTVPAPMGNVGEPEPAGAPVPDADDAMVRIAQLYATLPTSTDDGFEVRIEVIVDAALAVRDFDSSEPGVASALQDLSRAVAALRVERKAWMQDRAERQLVEIEATLGVIEQALIDGNLGAARCARETLPALALAESQAKRLQVLDARIAQLSHWQRWAGEGVRERLCEEAESLIDSPLHPQAIASRIKALRSEWRRLDQLEGKIAVAATGGIAKHFRALCRRASTATQVFFEEREKTRAANQAALHALIEEARGETADVAVLRHRRKRLATALSKLGEMPPASRSNLATEIRTRLAGLDASLAQHRDKALLARRRFLARLKRELAAADVVARLNLARGAESEWRALPRVDREAEAQLWRELQALLDPILDQARQRQREAEDHAAASASAAAAVLAELHSLAALSLDRLAHVDSVLETLIARWRALQAPRESDAPRHARRHAPERPEPERPVGGSNLSPELEDAFNAALAEVRQAALRALRARELAEIDALCSADELLERIASDAPLQQDASWRVEIAALCLGPAARAVVELRMQAIDASRDTAAAKPNDPERAELLAIRGELAVGLESPAHASALRRAEQMRRLAAKLEGAAPAAAKHEIRALLLELVGLDELAPDRRRELRGRLHSAYLRAAQ